MKIRLTEEQLSRIGQSMVNQLIGAILMTGKTTSVGHDQQVNYFKKGFLDGKIYDFTHDDLSGLLRAIEENPQTPVVLYSLAAKHADKVANAMEDKSKLIIVEPYYQKGGRTARAVQTAVTSGVPSTNVQVHPTKYYRGAGIVNNPTYTPEDMNHFEALTSAASTL